MMRASLAAGLLVMAMAAGGCNPPQGRDSGRLNVTTTTAAEERSAKIPLTSLAEASDKVSQDLARDVVRVSNEVGQGYRVVVVFGDLENKTQGVVNTTDFEMLRERIKSRLVQSSLFRENVKFVTGRAQLESLNQREMAPRQPDLLQEGTAQQPAPRNTLYTLYLNGSMYGSFRGNTNLYYLNFKLARASDGEEVFNSDYEIKRGP